MTQPRRKVADLTVEELRTLIRESVTQALFDFTQGTDDGLELREEFAAELEASIRAVEAGEPTIPAEEVARRHNLF